MPTDNAHHGYPAFDRRELDDDVRFVVLGTGELGGKARGLASIRRVLHEKCPEGMFPGVTVDIPRLAVVATDVFEQFMEANDLWSIATSGEPDDRIAHAFQRADFPTLLLGDLRAMIAQIDTPLAIRSSSLLEDALGHPFAGTYATKMVPNNQSDIGMRFRKLLEAIRFVYASTFFADARAYRRSIGEPDEKERMAAVIQQVVGRKHNERFYPTCSGVIRTHNFYPIGKGRAEDGVVSLALGLGKTIVDGGVSWSYCPRFPRQRPPFASAKDLMHGTQSRFWAVNMRPLNVFDPINEAEFLIEASISDAEYDNELKHIASTYDAGSDRIVLGTGRAGPRVLDFAPVLDLADVPLNKVVQHLAATCREAFGGEVEIEIAATFDPADGVPAEVGFLQVRPTLVDREVIDAPVELLEGDDVLVGCERVLGNGVRDSITDIVYVRPEAFEARHTSTIARHVAGINHRLTEEGRHCLAIGFGRWGSSDPWLGIPVTWPQISTARVIVEATREDMNVDASQGSHFFHNLTSFAVQYFAVRHDLDRGIDWAWLDAQPAVDETKFVRHVRLPQPLRCLVDGRSGRGVILKQAAE